MMILKLPMCRWCECLQLSPTFVERSCITNRCSNFPRSPSLLTDGGRTPGPKRVPCPGISGGPWNGKNNSAPNLSFWGLPSCMKTDSHYHYFMCPVKCPCPCQSATSLCSQSSQSGKSQSFADHCMRLERSFTHSTVTVLRAA